MSRSGTDTFGRSRPGVARAADHRSTVPKGSIGLDEGPMRFTGPPCPAHPAIPRAHWRPTTGLEGREAPDVDDLVMPRLT